MNFFYGKRIWLLKTSLSLMLTTVYCCSLATVWPVGPTSAYTMPSQVSILASDGDTIEIDQGTYESDVARWSANNLLIRGIGGKAHLKSNGNAYGGKAIWVIAGNNTIIENIEFSGCSVPDKNGAGIRQEGKNLVVRSCYFHNNENGILAGAVNPSTIIIEHCEFGYNGFGDGYSHNLYINAIDTLIFRYNYSHHANVGHEIKSRANVNYILYNRISNEADGTASRCIDLPNGGLSFIMGNIIMQGNNATNNNLISYGLEGLSNSISELYAVNNTLINKRIASGLFFHIQTGTSIAYIANNIIAGTGNLVNGLLTANIHNLITDDIDSVKFQDEINYNYNLTNLSPAIDAGIFVPAVNNFCLTPDKVYFHPAGNQSRIISGIIDIGAYEFNSSSIIFEQNNLKSDIYPNPAKDYIIISTPFYCINTRFELFNINGIKKMSFLINKNSPISIEGLRPGLYFYTIENNYQKQGGKLVKE